VAKEKGRGTGERNCPIAHWEGKIDKVKDRGAVPTGESADRSGFAMESARTRIRLLQKGVVKRLGSRRR